MGRFAILLVLGGALTFGIINLSMNAISNSTTENALSKYQDDQARNIANSAVEMIISKIADQPEFRTSVPESISLFDGTATYTVKDTLVSSSSLYANSLSNAPTGYSQKIYSPDKINRAGFYIPEFSSVFTLITGNNGETMSDGGNDQHGDNQHGQGDDHHGDDDHGHGDNGHGHGDDGHGHGDDSHGDDGHGGHGGGNGGNGGGSNINAIKITVTAKYQDISRTVSAVITQETLTSNLPQFFNYALLSGQNVSLNGNVNITDDNNSQWNANVHSNKNFQMSGNNTIKGFVTYSGTAYSNPSWRMDSQIIPNQNPDSQPNYNKTNQVDIPAFNPDDYKDKATTIYNSNKTLSGNITLGTKSNPEILYVGGDLSLKGTVSGYGTIIVKGNINISGNVDISSPDPSYCNLGLYTGGSVNASGNVTIHAQILTNQNINLSGNCKIYGTLTSLGVNNFSGNIDIYYHPANSVLTQPFWPQSGISGDPSSLAGGSSSRRLTVLDWYE